LIFLVLLNQALQQLGLTRRVALTVNNFSSAVPIIKESNLIAILPTDLMHSEVDYDALVIMHPPVDIPHTSISMLWHKRQSADKGLIWLRRHIKQIFIQRREYQIEKVLKFMK